MTQRPPAELKFWTWLKAHGLNQSDVAAAIQRSRAHVSHRVKFAGFNDEERDRILAWAREQRPKAQVTLADLFESEAA